MLPFKAQVCPWACSNYLQCRTLHNHPEADLLKAVIQAWIEQMWNLYNALYSLCLLVHSLSLAWIKLFKLWTLGNILKSGKQKECSGLIRHRNTASLQRWVQQFESISHLEIKWDCVQYRHLICVYFLKVICLGQALKQDLTKTLCCSLLSQSKTAKYYPQTGILKPNRNIYGGDCCWYHHV